MSTLHKRFSGVEGATDVLTFDLGCDRRASCVDAEIVVCADVALRRSGSQSAARRELALYVVHGILHLAGFDDHTDQTFADMHAREDALLLELGLGRVFANTPRKT